MNQYRLSGGLVDQAPFLTVDWPVATAEADFYASPTILTSPEITLNYTLFDAESHPVRFIRAFYSPNGGGQWFPATAAPGTVTTNLAASPKGVAHTFIWNADADLIESDNVVFRIEAYQGLTGPGPYQWPYVAAQTFPFRVKAPSFIRVVDQDGRPVPGAEVYRNDRAIGVTDQAGLLNPGPINPGDLLAALARQDEAPTDRAEHDGWAYRAYLTSQPYTVVAETGEQRLVVRRDKPLILFNLVVSIEWQADQAYLDDLAAAMKSASDYLYDLTDGQMAFGRVVIFNNSEMWSEADIQIASKNIVRPHAYIGGLISPDKSHVIRLGRFWDGRSGNQGPWSEPAGHRTIAHEFGHYGLHLYDEYIGFKFDTKDRVVNQWPAVCPDYYKDMKPEQDATNASAMYYHYLSSELSARNVPGMWSEGCEQTAQWQLTERETGRGESTWETLARMYADKNSPPRWPMSLS